MMFGVFSDIKPDNLLVTTSGHLKLMDFGMATPFSRLRKNKSASATGTIEQVDSCSAGSMWLENFSSLQTSGSDGSCQSFLFGDSGLMKTVVGNVHYTAPEVLAGNYITYLSCRPHMMTIRFT